MRREYIVGCLLIFSFSAACRDPVTCNCNAGCDCGPGLMCVTEASACAATDSTCASGQRFDPSAGAAAGFCVGEVPDMSMSQGDMMPDGATAPDMVVACGYAGEPCCGVPFLPCTAGLTCTANACRVSDVWFTGSYLVSLQPQGQTMRWNGTALERGPDFPAVGQRPLAIWGDAPNSYKAAGEDGYLWHYVSGSPERWQLCDGALGCNRPAGTVNYSYLFGFNMSDFWIGGLDSMYNCGGGNCTARTAGITGGWGVGQFWGVSSSDLWAAAYTRMLHYNGTTWTPYTIGGRGVWGAKSDDVWAAGSEIYHWNGTQWSQAMVLPVTGTIYAMHGTATDDVWGLGYHNPASNAPISIHWDGASWTSKPFPVASAQMQAIWAGSKTEAWACSYDGLVFRWDGAAWSQLTLPAGINANTSWHSVSGSARPRP